MGGDFPPMSRYSLPHTSDNGAGERDTSRLAHPDDPNPALQEGE